MFQFLNQIIRMRFLKKTLKSSDGQIAIILILVIAAALIFYAVSLNLGQFTLARTLVTIASNTSASMLASDMASYGQSLSSSSLDGGRKVCGWTGIMAAIISIVIIVIAIIVGIYSSGSASGPVLKGGALVIAGLVLAVAALVIQIMVIQPGITEAWNEIISATLSMRNQFTEGAIQSALGKAVTDVVKVPDVVDQDRDRLWVSEANLGNEFFEDVVERFGMYYSERLRQIKDKVEQVEVAAFIAALRELLYQGTDDWGIHDPVPGSSCFGRAECHPCCIPDSATVDGETLTDLRPELCDDLVDWAAQCELASPYQSPPGAVAYPWLYDMYFENPYNAFLSFRELIGLDDEHRDFYKDENDPNSDPTADLTTGRVSQLDHIAGQEGFYLEDATGFYAEPNPVQTDPLPGIYPFFYKMADWGVDLANVEAHIAADPNSRECHWCDDHWGASPCGTCTGLLPHPHPLEIPQLVLPEDPASLVYNTTYFVDWLDNPVDVLQLPDEPYPPLAVDQVTFPVPGDIIARNDVCAQDTIYPLPPSADGFWKRGADRFCKPVAPYFMDCPKCGGVDCSCPPASATNFPEDVVDDLVYVLADFIQWAQDLILRSADLAFFSEDFPNWYPDVAVWIEPEAPPATSTTNPPCFVCNLTLPDGTPVPEGYLWILLKEITVMRDRILGWINNYDSETDINEGYKGETCADVWCVPDPTLGCPEVPSGEGEDATFDTNGNGIQGDVEDIVGCLNYNVNGYDHVAAEAFKDCLNSCGAANCTPGASLPEFHLDGVTPYEYPAVALSCVAGSEWLDAMSKNIALAVNPPTSNRSPRPPRT